MNPSNHPRHPRLFRRIRRVLPLLAAFAATEGISHAAVTRGPYLQLGTPTSIVIRWRTDLTNDTQVTYGTNLAVLDLTNSSPAQVTEHEIQLTNLAPSTKYYYSIGTTDLVYSVASTNQYFITAPPPGTAKDVRVWVIGDAGTANANQTAVRDAFYQLNGTNHTDLWLQLGDNAYNTGTDLEYQAAVFNMYSNLLPKSVTWPTLGNHDTAQSTAFVDNYPYFQIFTLPVAGEAGGAPSGTEHYYSFDYANVHFVCLDSMTADRSPNGAMANWLRADLQSNTNQWIVAFWHHPPYTKGSHNSDVELPLIEMRTNLVPILEAYGVDLVLTGHSHSYERSYLLDGHYGLSGTLTSAMMIDAGNGRETGTGAYKKPSSYGIANRGAVYAVAGSSGQISGGSLNHPAMYISTNVLGSMLLEFRTNRMDAIFLRETGATNDQFTILKANYPPVASNLSFAIPAEGPAQFTLAGSDINRDPIQFASTTPAGNGLLSDFNPVTGTITYTPAHAATNTDSFTFTTTDGQTNSTPGTVTISIMPLADANQNGLPDSWEAQNYITDPNGDEDHDGMTNLEEYRAGTNPNDDQSWLRVRSIVRNGSTGYHLTWKSVGGVRYRICFSDSDANGGFTGTFIPLVRPATAEMDPAPPGTPSAMSFTDDFSLTGVSVYGARYYRIQVLP